DKNDCAASELHGKVQRLKARVAAVSNLAELMNDDLVAAHVDLDRPHVPLALADIASELQALVIGQAARGAPPIVITSVMDIGPRRQLPRIVDGDYSGFAARFL